MIVKMVLPISIVQWVIFAVNHVKDHARVALTIVITLLLLVDSLVCLIQIISLLDNGGRRNGL